MLGNLAADEMPYLTADAMADGEKYLVDGTGSRTVEVTS